MPANASLEGLSQRLDELTDLFKRRLLDDREKARAIGTLQSELEHARDGTRRQVLEPIVRQLILVLDRIDGQLDTGRDGLTFLGTVSEEILEILHQYGVQRVDQFERFDPAYAEAGDLRATADRTLDGMPAGVVRPAYLWSGTLLRPATVALWHWSEEPLH